MDNSVDSTRLVCMAMFVACASAWMVTAFSTEGLPGIRIVPSQHVGVYYRAGKLLNMTSPPGLHSYVPLYTKPISIFTGIDNDIVPPSRMPLTDCRSKDGGRFGVRVDVSNRLAAEDVVETLLEFGVNYDAITIFQQVDSYVKDVCSRLTSHEIRNRNRAL